MRAEHIPKTSGLDHGRLKPDIFNAASHFAYNGRPISAEECKRGHINSTYFVVCEDGEGGFCRYVLQAINTNVFKHPEYVMSNMVNVTEHIRKKISLKSEAAHEVINLVKSIDGGYSYRDFDGRVWRSYEFVEGENYQSADSVELMELVGRTFGRFQMYLSDFDASKLYYTIPDFHNTSKRLENLERAIKNDPVGRLKDVDREIEFIRARKNKCGYIVEGIESGRLPLRVTHNDTKLNNIMVNGQTTCVIDLDTVMPGSVLADFGDAIRFGASTGAEDERDLSSVTLRLDMFESFTRGFIDGAGGLLTPYEIESFPMGAYLMTLELGIRFLEDYLNGDKYFRISSPDHNLARARKQLKLVEEMEAKMDGMNSIVEKYIK